jgi:hypothetical protein
LVDLHPFSQEEVLPNAMIRDIMVANPHAAKNDSVLMAIDSRFEPMPDSMYAEIIMGRLVNDVIDSLTLCIDRKRIQCGVAARNLLIQYLYDTIRPGMQDSINNLLHYDFKIQSKYTLSLRTLEAGDVLGAEIQMAAIPDNYSFSPAQTTEYELFTDMFNIKKRAVIHQASLSFDSTQVNSLLAIVSSDTTGRFLPSVFARNALHLKGLMTYEEPLVFDDEVPSATMPRKTMPLLKPSRTRLSIWPNPADRYIIIEYKCLYDVQPDKLIISRSNGDVVSMLMVDKRYDQVVYGLDELQNGTYIATLTEKGKYIDSKKFVVIAK